MMEAVGQAVPDFFVVYVVEKEVRHSLTYVIHAGSDFDA